MILLVSCQKDLLKTGIVTGDSSIIIQEGNSYVLENNQAEEVTVMLDEPYVFLSETVFYKWSHIVGLENRFKARTDFPLNMIQISGDTVVYPNDANNYIGSYFNNRPFTYVWTVDYCV